MTTGNRLYKDRLFRFVFNDKKKLLSLYNALNHSHYEDEEELEINTLEDQSQHAPAGAVLLFQSAAETYCRKQI